MSRNALYSTIFILNNEFSLNEPTTLIAYCNISRLLSHIPKTIKTVPGSKKCNSNVFILMVTIVSFWFNVPFPKKWTNIYKIIFTRCFSESSWALTSTCALTATDFIYSCTIEPSLVQSSEHQLYHRLYLKKLQISQQIIDFYI